jgi:hypothetical protein
MNKGFIGFIAALTLLVVMAVILGNLDPITPAIVEARSETSVGVVTMDVLDQGLAFITKLLMGATIAGVLSFIWFQGGKLYRRWWSEKLTRRWKPGPNAQFQQQSPKLPKLTREDIMLMMLGNQGRMPVIRQTRHIPRNDPEADHEINIHL